MKTWTEKEIRFLQKAYNNEPIEKIARTLLRSEGSIRSKVHSLRKKGMAFDRKRDVREKTEQQLKHENKVFDFSDPINAGEAFMVANPDESDDIEAAKRVAVEKALYNPVDNA
tara:strand:+ start:172 stop:510 length:339 start_codon:yes stop_codon:yes gene_type:complete